MDKVIKLRINGRVQGVNFRNSVKKIADNLEIKGWIRNEVDGSVSLVCQGEIDKLNEFIQELRESPGFSNVSGVDELEIKNEENFDGFNVIREGGFFSDQRRSFKNLGKEIFGNGRV